MTFERVRCFGLTPSGHLGLRAQMDRVGNSEERMCFRMIEAPVRLDETPVEAAWHLAKSEFWANTRYQSVLEIENMLYGDTRYYTYSIGVEVNHMQLVERGVQWLSPAYMRSFQFMDNTESTLLQPLMREYVPLLLEGLARFDQWRSGAKR